MPAANSRVVIARLALSNIGSNSRIEEIGENSAEGKEVELWFDTARQQALEAYDWSFARKRQTLAQHADAAPTQEWSYRYQMPADALVPRHIENPLGKDVPPIPFDVEASSDGSLSILTNVQEACLVYTEDVLQPTLFSSFFVVTMAHLLASYIALPLTGSIPIRDGQIQAYISLLRTASAHDANKRVPDAPKDADFIQGR
jgi:hypothetical protein